MPTVAGDTGEELPHITKYIIDCLYPPNSYRNRNPQCDGIGRWGLWEVISHEDGATMNGVSVLIKETPGGSL